MIYPIIVGLYSYALTEEGCFTDDQQVRIAPNENQLQFDQELFEISMDENSFRD